MTTNSVKKILVVDDYDAMRMMIVKALQLLKYENIAEAKDGVEALKLVKENEFDLVISDWTMPEMDGLDLLKEIRADEKIKALPVIMVTAVSEPESIKSAIQAGANGYVVKPITVKTLKDKTDQIFARAN